MEIVNVYKDELYDLAYEFYKEEDGSFGLEHMTLTLNSDGEAKIVLQEKKTPYSLSLVILERTTSHWLMDNVDCYFSEDDNEWFIEGDMIRADSDLDEYKEECFLEAQQLLWFKNTGYVDGKLVILNWIS